MGVVRFRKCKQLRLAEERIWETKIVGEARELGKGQVIEACGLYLEAMESD